MSDEQPDWAQKFNESLSALYAASRKTNNVLAAQAALGWAYRGDLTNTQAALASRDPEQLREISAAATLLANLADEELTTR